MERSILRGGMFSCCCYCYGVGVHQTSSSTSIRARRRRSSPRVRLILYGGNVIDYLLGRRTVVYSSSAPTTTTSDNEIAREDLLQFFLKERQLNGDLVSKTCDLLWKRDELKYVDSEIKCPNPQQSQAVMEIENLDGFLKLTKTIDWITGDETAPINNKVAVKELRDDRERRKRLSLLEYDAIKKEMMLLTIGIGTVCSGYCLVALSLQASISYAAGVIFSCLYLQLLYNHVDNLTRESVPQIFKQKKSNKIGIRSEDLENAFERVLRGSAMALSSPRLVIPAAIYGIYELSYHSSNDYFSFQLLPAMVGIFAYKAAALVQVYRDNEDLKLIFPGDEEDLYN